MSRQRLKNGASELQAINRRRDIHRKTIPALAQAGPVSVWMVLFVTIPMLYIIYVSFMSRGVFGDVVYEFSLESYQTLLDSTYFKVIVKSLQVALFTTVACLLLGYPFAYYIARKPPEVASRLIMLIMIPFWTNSLMRLNSWLLLFQTSGPVNTFLQWAGITSEPITFIYTDPLVMLGLVTNMLPFAVLPLYSTIEKLQNSLLEASSDLGANPRQTFFRITLPLTFPGIFSAVILVFIPSLGIYTVSDMLGGGKVLYIGNIIKNQFGAIRNWPLGAALSVLLLVITGLLIFVYTRFAKLEDMEWCDMAALSKTQRRKRRLGIVGDVYAILIYTVLYIPVAVMMVFSFNDQKYNFYWNGFTTEWYGKLLENDALIGSLWYSLIIAVLATVISVVIGTLGALGLKRYEFKGKRFINSMLYVPIIVPEIVLAVALLIIFMNIGLSLGLGSILVGHCTFCIPYAVVTIKGRISGDGYELEEASMDLGANRIQTFLRVTLPSMVPGIMSAAFLSFTLSIDDVVMSNMLSGARNSTLPVLILSMNRTGVTPDVNALTTIMILVIVAAMLLSNGVKALLRRREKAAAR